MLKLLRRIKSRLRPQASAAARLVVDSPLNDAALMTAVFGSERPSPARVQAVYFSLEPAARPLLSHYFDPAYYLERNPDVAASGVDPYLHFLSAGAAEGRDPHPLVDLAFLRSQAGLGRQAWDLPGLVAALRSDQLLPHRLFDPAHYLASNDDVRGAGLPALEHFLSSGAREGRRPNPYFDVDDYQARVPEASADRYKAFVHFVRDMDATVGRGAGPDASVDDAGPGSSAANPPVVPDFGGREYVGSFDAVEEGVALGWAHRTSAPEERLDVEIIANGRVVGRGRASGVRTDLRDLGIGDGNYHFAIRLSRDLSDGHAHTLHARVAGVGDGEGEIGGSHVLRTDAPRIPFDLMPVAETESLAREFVAGDMGLAAGFVERVSDVALLLATGDIDAASDGLDALESDFPGHALVSFKRAEVAMLRDRLEEAEKAYALASESTRLAAWGLLGLGNVHRLRGDARNAELCYLRAHGLAPTLAPLDFRLSRLRRRQRLSGIRASASRGDVAGATASVVQELLSTPEDAAVCQLATAILAGADEPAQTMDPVLVDARRALALLEAVVRHRTADGGGA